MPIGLSLRPSVVEALGRWIDAGAPATGLVPGAEALPIHAVTATSGPFATAGKNSTRVIDASWDSIDAS
jgi:hypothetical protein